MHYLRDLSLLTCCALTAALATACKDSGGETATDTATGTQGSTADPTGDPGTGTASPTTGTGGPTTDTPTGGPTTDTPTTDTPTTAGPTTDDPSTDSATTDDTTTGAPACPHTPVDGEPQIALELLASGFDRPVHVLAHPKQHDRLFVVEQGGHIKILEPGQTSAPPDDEAFLYVAVKNANATKIGPEQGLLGFAFHPDFPADPRVYVNYNPEGDGTGPTHIAEFKLDPQNPDRVDPASRRLVYAVGQPAGNHNGGQIAFGADGMLYIGMGDGGGKDDQYNTSRDPLSPHAKILRINVEPDGKADSNKACAACPMVSGFDFTVPADNPHVGDAKFAPEVYASGMRNPWRFSFDPANGDLYVADVGQNVWEEVSIVEAGLDYGWDAMEGNHCFGGNQCDTSAGPNQPNKDGLVAPIAEYSHGNGRCSITGVGVYRSCEVPAWAGVYFYADYCSSELFALKWDGTNVQDLGVVATLGEPVVGSGHNHIGDVFVTTVVVDALNTLQDGKVYRIVPAG